MKRTTAARPSPSAQVGHHIGPAAGVQRAHAPGVGFHHRQVGADMRREVGLVDDQQVALGDAGPAFARDLLATGDVDHVQRQVRQLGAEGGGQVVAAGFDEDDVGVGEAVEHAVDGLEVDAGVFADRGVRATAGLDAHDAFGRQRAGHGEQALVLLGVDVVGDDHQVPALAHRLAQLLDQRGLARADRAADADAQRRQFLRAAGDVVHDGHERNNLEY